MFLLSWLQYQKQPLQTRLTAGFSALVIIVCLFLLIVCRFFIVDKVSLYADPQTVLYLKMETGGRDDYYKNKIIESLLAEYGLADLDRHWLNQELAVTCSSPANHLDCRLIIRSGKASKIKDYLRGQQIAFQNPARDIIIVGDASQTAKKSHNPFFYWQFQDGLFKKDLLLVLRPPQKLSSELEKGLAFLPKNLKLRGQTSNQGIVLAAFGNRQIKPLEILPVDLLIKTTADNKKSTANWPNLADNCLIDKDLANILSSQNLVLTLTKKNADRNFLNGYDFFLSSGQQLKADDQKKLESFLLSLAQITESTEKNFYLNDGTKITLLNKNTSIAFAAEGNLMVLPLKNGNKLYYSNNNGLMAGDNQNFQPRLPDNLPDSYIFARIAGLPDNSPFKIFLKDFSFLEITDKAIVIR